MDTEDGRDTVNDFLKNDDNSEYREVETDLIWQFYVDNYMDSEVIQHLGNKSSLTFFSIGVNGGKGRGAKALQTAINKVYESQKAPMKVGADGAIGRGTRKALADLDGNGLIDDDQFNQYMLEYMDGFYKYLITNNESKYGLYKKGWRNRLVGLGFTPPQNDWVA